MMSPSVVCFYWCTACVTVQDRERRDDELNQLRHLLEENHAAVTKWKAQAAEKAKVCN